MPKKNSVAGVPGVDPGLPDVSLILGGVKRHLCFDFNGIVLAEQATGINLLKASWGEPSAANLRGLLWASLIKEDPTLTVEQVGELITMRNIVGIWEAVRLAWFGSVQQADESAGQPGEEKAQAKA